MLGETYTDPVTGIQFDGDADAYAKASESLLEAETLLRDLRQLETMQSQAMATFTAAGGSMSLYSGVLTSHAQVLTDIDEAEQVRAGLRSFVDRYRYYVLGSGLAGLGWVSWVFALLGTIASWIAWMVTARQRADTARVELQQTIADAVTAGTITADQGQAILNTPVTGETGFLAGLMPYVLLGLLGYMFLAQGPGLLSRGPYRRRNPWRFYGAFKSPRKAAARKGEIPGAEVKTYRMKRQGTRHVVRKWERNPPTDVIPGRVEEIRYQRTGKYSGPYKHKFTSPVTMRTLKNGKVLLAPAKGGKKLWVEIPD